MRGRTRRKGEENSGCETKENNSIHYAFNRKWHALFTQAQNYVLKR